MGTQLCGKETKDFLDRVLARGDRYAAKFSAQEASFLEQCARIHCDSKTLVVDLGCGNGMLALLCSLVFKGSSLGVDRRTPHDNCRAELFFTEPPWRDLVDFHRMEICASESRKVWERIQEIARERSLDKVLIICKHLCGAGSDYCIRFIREILTITTTSPQQESNLQLLGAIFTTCCTHKIPDPDNDGRDLRFYLGEYYNNNTTTTTSDYDYCPEVRSEDRFSQLCKWAAWRNTANGKGGENFSPAHTRVAELVEDLVQAPRLRALARLPGCRVVEQLRFTEQSMQDRLVICQLGERDGCTIASGKTTSTTTSLSERLAAVEASIGVENIPLRLRQADGSELL